MAYKTKFSVICETEAFFLYETEKGVSKLCGTYTKTEEFLSALKERDIDQLYIFDKSDAQSIRTEKCPPFLNIIDFFSWYTKKKTLDQQNLAWGYTKPYFKKKEVLSVGTTRPIFNEKDFLSLKDMSVDVFSYGMAMGKKLHNIFKIKQSQLKGCLLVSIEKDYRMMTWFFEENRLLFWRSWPISNESPLEPQMKSAVLDTLRYLEKLTSNMGSLCFFLENRSIVSGLSNAFPDAFFLYGEELAVGSGDVPALTHFVLEEKNHGIAIKKIRPWSYLRHVYGMRALNTCAALVCLYFSYDCCDLMYHNRIILSDLKKLESGIASLQKEMEHMPLSYIQAVCMKKNIELSNKQREKLERFIENLPDILGPEVRLESLLIGPQKACLSMGAQEEEVVSGIMQNWEQSLPECLPNLIESDKSPIMQTGAALKDCSLDPLFLECVSPFKEHE